MKGLNFFKKLLIKCKQYITKSSTEEEREEHLCGRTMPLACLLAVAEFFP